MWLGEVTYMTNLKELSYQQKHAMGIFVTNECLNMKTVIPVKQNSQCTEIEYCKCHNIYI